MKGILVLFAILYSGALAAQANLYSDDFGNTNSAGVFGSGFESGTSGSTNRSRLSVLRSPAS